MADSSWTKVCHMPLKIIILFSRQFNAAGKKMLLGVVNIVQGDLNNRRRLEDLFDLDNFP